MRREPCSVSPQPVRTLRSVVGKTSGPRTRPASSCSSLTTTCWKKNGLQHRQPNRRRLGALAARMAGRHHGASLAQPRPPPSGFSSPGPSTKFPSRNKPVQNLWLARLEHVTVSALPAPGNMGSVAATRKDGDEHRVAGVFESVDALVACISRRFGRRLQ